MKIKELQKLSKADGEKKLAELKMELMKSKIGASKAGTAKIRQIRKIIARIHTINNKKLLKKT